MLDAVLFSLYHLWTPWQNPGRIVALLPRIYIVWRKRSVRLSIIVHVTVNLTFLLFVLAVSFRTSLRLSYPPKGGLPRRR